MSLRANDQLTLDFQATSIFADTGFDVVRFKNAKFNFFSNTTPQAILCCSKFREYLIGAQESQRRSKNFHQSEANNVLIYQAHVASLKEMKSAEFSTFPKAKEPATTALLSTSSSHEF